MNSECHTVEVSFFESTIYDRFLEDILSCAIDSSRLIDLFEASSDRYTPSTI